MQSRRVVFYGSNLPLQLETALVPQPQTGEAIVRVNCCTVCRSDIHTYSGKRHERLPTILGHEITGSIHALGSELCCARTSESLQMGDRVTWSITASCFQCEPCRRGLPQKCETVFKYGHAELTERHPLSGGLADHCHLVRGTTIVKLPISIPDEVAAPASCTTATIVAAARAAGGFQNKSVAIIGAGMLGLTAIAMASEQAAKSVVAFDTDARRLAKAMKFGAREARQWTFDSVGHLTPDRESDPEFDVVLELSGQSGAVERSIPLATLGGTVILVGSVMPSPRTDFDPECVVRRLVTIRGVHNYAPEDLVGAIDFLESSHDKYPFTSLVEGSFPLESADEAFRFALARRPYRVSIRPQ